MIEDRIEKRTRFGISWLIVRDGEERQEVFTLATESERTLPVFSFEEEALLFICLSGIGDGWQASKNGVADLVAILAEPCADARRVALDPIPEVGLHGPHALVSLPREAFVELLLAAMP